MCSYTIDHKIIWFNGRCVLLFLDVCNDCEVCVTVFEIQQLLWHSCLLDMGWLHSKLISNECLWNN